jgi:uncharacterized membrane protein
MRASNARYFFSNQEKEDIQHAIQHAELDTSGEIRVHIENRCLGDVMNRAAHLFKKLGMHKTDLRNGVLIYLAIDNRKFAIIGDLGINSVVPEDFWEHIKLDMLEYFRNGEFAEGLIHAVTEAGTQLKKHFPYATNDVNELPDDLSFGES